MVQARNIKSAAFFALAVALVASLLTQMHAQAANTFPGVNDLVSVNDVDVQGGNAYSQAFGVSADGNIVLFFSAASNLPSANSAGGLYERNMKTGVTTRVDVSSGGTLADHPVSTAVMSENGRYIAFESDATNLIDGHTYSYGEGYTYIRDMQADTTNLLVTDGSGNPASCYPTSYVSATGISNDGRFATVQSTCLAHNLVSGTIRHDSTHYDIMLLDRSTNTRSVLDTPSSTYSTYESQMSCDGSLIAFDYTSSGTTDGDIDLADLRDGSPQVTSIGSGHLPHISCNGDYLVYSTKSHTEGSPVPPGLSTTASHLIEYDRIGGSKTYVDSDSSGNFSTGYGTGFVANVSDKGDIALQWMLHPYLKHVSDGSGTLEGIEKTPGGTYLSGDYTALQPNSISADGKYVIFNDDAYNLGLTTSDSGHFDVMRAQTGL